MPGGGDDVLDFFVTGAHAYDKWGFQASLGYEQALDSYFNSSIFHWHDHVDYELFEDFFLLIEVTGLNALDEGNRTALGNFEGNDAVNFGSTNSSRVVTGNIGAHYKFTNHVQLGVSYEAPISDQKDLLLWRTNLDLVVHF